MAEIVNLRRARKAKDRMSREKEAEANRAKFGTPKPERERTNAMREKSARDIDAHKIDHED